MNKQAILNTIVSYWSEENDCFIVESPLFDRIAGVGDTPEQALNVFTRLLDDGYLSYLEGKVPGYDKPGRPSKGAVPVSYRLQPGTKQDLLKIAKELDCSQGEVVDYLVYRYKIQQLEQDQEQRRQRRSRKKNRRLA